MPALHSAAAALCACLAAACGSSSPDGAGGGGPTQTEMAGHPAADAAGEDLAGLRARAQAALAQAIPNAAGAHYARLRRGVDGAVCGAVDAAGAGVFHPFVVTPGGAGMVSASPELRLDDPNDPFPDLHMRYCATVEELEGMRVTLNGLAPAAPAQEVAPVLDLPDAPAEETAEPADAETPRRGGDDSFFNAIVRAPRSAAPHR